MKYYMLGGRRVAMRKVSEGQPETLYYLFSDHLGSTSVAYDTDNNTWTTQRYYPYGSTRSGGVPTDRLFADQRFDGTIELYQMGARWYDPALGRFISADPIVPEPGNPQALNRYSYVLNNPLRYSDPSGHLPEDWSWRDIIITVFTFDIFAMQDLCLGQPRGTTTRQMREQIEEVQAWQRRNIREPVEARFPVVKTIDEVAESPEFQMGLTAAMMTANTFAPPGGITNRVPERMVRVVSLRGGRELSDITTLGPPGKVDALVTAADDIAGITTSRGLAERLTLVDEAGNLIEGPFAVFEFDTPASGVASPVFRSSPGFVGGGQTAGGAREFVIPNLSLSDLENLIIRIIH